MTLLYHVPGETSSEREGIVDLLKIVFPNYNFIIVKDYNEYNNFTVFIKEVINDIKIK